MGGVVKHALSGRRSHSTFSRHEEWSLAACGAALSPERLTQGLADSPLPSGGPRGVLVSWATWVLGRPAPEVGRGWPDAASATPV